MSSNVADFNNGIEMWLKRVRNMTTELYQDMVWDLFLTVVRETPQWSGKAVANWNISIGSVGTMYDDSLGDDSKLVELMPVPGSPMSSSVGTGHLLAPHKKGDRKWETVAWNRNRPIKKTIKVNDRVFIYNLTVGDEGFSYLEGFQSSPDWPTKLREVNRPYETVLHSVAVVTHRWASRGMNMINTRGDRLGGLTLEDGY